MLSYFHRGLFWGIIFSWMAVISGFGGAVITKVFYLDKRKTVVVANDSVSPTARYGDNLQETEEFSLAAIDWKPLESSPREFTIYLADRFLLLQQL